MLTVGLCFLLFGCFACTKYFMNLRFERQNGLFSQIALHISQDLEILSLYSLSFIFLDCHHIQLYSGVFCRSNVLQTIGR